MGPIAQNRTKAEKHMQQTYLLSFHPLLVFMLLLWAAFDTRYIAFGCFWQFPPTRIRLNKIDIKYTVFKVFGEADYWHSSSQRVTLLDIDFLCCFRNIPQAEKRTNQYCCPKNSIQDGGCASQWVPGRKAIGVVRCPPAQRPSPSRSCPKDPWGTVVLRCHTNPSLTKQEQTQGALRSGGKVLKSLLVCPLSFLGIQLNIHTCY